MVYKHIRNVSLKSIHDQKYLRDCFFMRLAINFARNAQLIGEVPIGAVLVSDDTVLSGAFNQPIRCNDPSAHAELLALREAGRRIGNYRLINCELFTTLEPCVMCAGAIIHARVRRLVFGAFNAKAGAAGSVLNVFGMNFLNHHTIVNGGIEQEICQQLLQNFFQKKRDQNSRKNLSSELN